jgi:hypothetical protein
MKDSMSPPVNPHGKKGHHRLSDSRCDTMRKQVEGKTEHDANVFFCRQEFPEAKRIIEGEKRVHSAGKSNGDTYKDQCKHYLKHNTTEKQAKNQKIWLAGWLLYPES